MLYKFGHVTDVESGGGASVEANSPNTPIRLTHSLRPPPTDFGTMFRYKYLLNASNSGLPLQIPLQNLFNLRFLVHECSPRFLESRDQPFC